MSMVYELTSLAAGSRKTEAVNNVVESALNQRQQVLTSLAFHLLRLLIVHTELLLKNAVDKLYLLLLCELNTVLALLSSHLSAGITVRGLLAVTHNSG